MISCNLSIKTDSKEYGPKGGVIPPMDALPFVNIGLEEARNIVLQDNTDKRRPCRQLLVVIMDPNDDIEKVVYDLGYREKDKQKWNKNYVSIILKSDATDAQKLIEQYYIQDFPASIKESISISGDEIFSTIWYGNMPQVSEKSNINIKSIAQKLKQKYQSGDIDKRLILQLRSHLDYLEMNPETTRELYLKLTDDYLNQFSKNELSTYAGYRILKKEMTDVRFSVVQKLLNDRSYYNKQFIKIAKANVKNKSNWFDADWILNQAIQKSFQTAAEHSDEALFQKAMEVKEAFAKNHMNQWIAKSILEFHLKRDNQGDIKRAALRYFALNENWYYSKDDDLMEGGANAIQATSEKSSEWQLAERWISRAIEKQATPTRYRLQLNLLTKLGRSSKLPEVLAKIETYKTEFSAFQKLYPERNRPIKLTHHNITAREYKSINSIPRRFDIFYSYIAREGSIYKKGQKVEPIALLDETDTEVEILTRVHLATRSILPVTHYRSYYIKSKFKKDGEHLMSQYVTSSNI